MKTKDMQEQVAALATGETLQKPIIVAYGLMNAGKSFLMNMLTRHVDTECFKTNDVRETVANAQFESPSCIYVDTPGLDANSADDEQAQRGVSRGDVVIFVHQPQGELEAKEIGFLQSLGADFGAAAASNIVIVLSKMEKESTEKISAVEARIAQQCQDVLGFAPCIFKVSGKRYRDGVLKQQPAMIALSGIDALDACLQEMVADVHTVRARKRAAQVVALMDKVERARLKAQQRRDGLYATIVDSFAPFGEQVDQLRHFLQERGSLFKKI
jgi:tRNA U34 5-carboxymethylaminomethyl modifying GTPase MnmE/TrmE